MALAPKKPCRQIGCSKLTQAKGGYCPRHTRAESKKRWGKDKRPNSSQRGYDADWQRAREQYLRKHPFCEMSGHVATMVHHKVPISQGGARLDEANFQALCDNCHKVHGDGR